MTDADGTDDAPAAAGGEAEQVEAEQVEQAEQAEVVGGPELGALGGAGLEGLLEQAQNLMAAQAEAAEQVVEGVAGGGVVRIRVTGGGLVERVTIDPAVVDPDDVAMLEDLVVAALRDVNERLGALQRDALGGLDGLLGGGSLDDLLGGD